MSSISQGGGYKDIQSGGQTLSSTSTQSQTANTVTQSAVGSIQERQQNPFSGNQETLTNLIQLLIDQISKWKDKKGKQPPQSQPQPLQLNKDQDQAIRNRFGIFGELNYEVLDNNRDRKLSAGDELVISGGFTGGEISRQKLTQKDVDAINGSGLTDAQSQLDANRKQWESQGIDDYSFTLQRSCFCRGDAIRPINIEVRDGSVTSARYADTGELIPDDRQTNKQSIYNLSADGLFNLVDQAIKGGAAQVDVSYDKQYGIPTSIYIDQSKQIADEEMGYSITNFRPEPSVTTLAVGEEDGGGGPVIIDPPVEPPIATTKALGEEDGGIKPGPIKPPVEPPIATTLALGEEDGGYLGPPIKPPVDDPIVTTQAVGEEDGGGYQLLQ
ncbi:DUF6174 domain-containing protein [Thiothrix nivea]|uniref:Uncharacterized protein n=1 Tax=Thiothrix nivea (strain ATCC 35100 / DSM 5205 / JP2) TaxID=870187 RepID=A0A656HH44_THINJ|nr:DUF6174 domain-containing protein [Thiothrix nivea]EIJ36341.1 hypothetical protein Thini_3841 [Thiothrix nivea DSM 5205]